jgi:hypothetical protein
MDLDLNKYYEPDGTESDEALRRVYGEHALFSRVGTFTLVHLDSPSPEDIARRVAEFDPDEFFFDDCPLCQSARAEGGHVVFDGPEPEDPLRDGPASDAFERGLAELAASADAFGELLTGAVPDEVAARYREDVEALHDRLVETLWSQESTGRVQAFELQFARAMTTLAEVRATAPGIGERAFAVERALDELASVWRSL